MGTPAGRSARLERFLAAEQVLLCADNVGARDDRRPGEMELQIAAGSKSSKAWSSRPNDQSAQAKALLLCSEINV
jgi:hypothetical protein